MKTSELTGAALDWAVAKCESIEGKIAILKDGDAIVLYLSTLLNQYHPSTSWAQGGQIVEREGIAVQPVDYLKGRKWLAGINGQELQEQPHVGETPLIAAMRCYVSSKLGDEVEIPKGLS